MTEASTPPSPRGGRPAARPRARASVHDRAPDVDPTERRTVRRDPDTYSAATSLDEAQPLAEALDPALVPQLALALTDALAPRVADEVTARSGKGWPQDSATGLPGGDTQVPLHGRRFGPLGRLGAWTATHFRPVLVVWLLIVVVLGAFAPKVEHALAGAGWKRAAPTRSRRVRSCRSSLPACRAPRCRSSCPRPTGR